MGENRSKTHSFFFSFSLLKIENKILYLFLILWRFLMMIFASNKFTILICLFFIRSQHLLLLFFLMIFLWFFNRFVFLFFGNVFMIFLDILFFLRFVLFWKTPEGFVEGWKKRRKKYSNNAGFLFCYNQGEKKSLPSPPPSVFLSNWFLCFLYILPFRTKTKLEERKERKTKGCSEI